MSDNREERFLERWKSVIEFSKTVLGLAVSVLTLLLGAVIVGQLKLGWAVYAAGGLFLFSIVLSLQAFGKGIDAIGDARDNDRGVFCANLAAFVMVLGIVLVVFARPDEKTSVDAILAKVQEATRTTSFDYDPKKLRSLQLTGDNYELIYEDADGKHAAVYSVSQAKVTSVR